jgi:dolichol kinase
MSNQNLFVIIFFVVFLSVILLSEYLYKRFALQPEYTRKIIHVISTLFSLAFLVVFQSYVYVLLLGLTFFLILFIGKHFNVFKSIDTVERKTVGSYLLPISICLLFFLARENNNKLYFILPVLILGISDPLAGIFGTVYKNKTRKIIIFKYQFDKTILGSGVFLISTCIITFIILKLFFYTNIQLYFLSLIIVCGATIVEIISSRGTDNITVPLTVFMILYLMR